MEEQKIVMRDIESVHPYELNAKKHDEKQVAKIAESIRKFGWRGNPIIVDKDGTIISGHGRRLAAISLGLKKVPVSVVTDMDAKSARAFRLADNRVAISDIDTDILQEELLDIGDYGNYLDGIFDTKELDFSVADLSEIDDSVFRTSIEEITEEQKDHIDEKIKEFDDEQVGVVKVMGFRTVSGEYAVYISRFIAEIEAKTHFQGAKALGEFCKQYVGE